MQRLLSVLVVATAACSHTPEPARTAAYPMDVRLERLEGGQARLATQAGQVVVVNFFATWCLPCVAEVPYLNTLHARPGVTVIGISLDGGGREILVPFRDRFDLRYPILLADDEVVKGLTPFGPVPGIPASFLLDQEGRVVIAIMGMLEPAAFDPLVEKVLAGRRRGTVP